MISYRKSVLKYFIMLLFGVLFVLISCYPNGPSATGELDVVATFYDDRADFGQITTFGMPDSIVHIQDSTNQDVEISRQYDEQILARVRGNLEKLGYEYKSEAEIDTTDPSTLPDVIVTVAATATKNYAGYTSYPWYGYWGWYWPGYGPGWGGYYPWYGGTVVYSYTSGTLFIDMFDPEQADNENKLIPSIWVAAINGLLEGSAASAATRLQTTIDQAFIQSPYLGAQ